MRCSLPGSPGFGVVCLAQVSLPSPHHLFYSAADLWAAIKGTICGVPATSLIPTKDPCDRQYRACFIHGRLLRLRQGTWSDKLEVTDTKLDPKTPQLQNLDAKARKDIYVIKAILITVWWGLHYIPNRFHCDLPWGKEYLTELSSQRIFPLRWGHSIHTWNTEATGVTRSLEIC